VDDLVISLVAKGLTALHWDQARTLAGQRRPDFGVRFKRRDPLSAPARVRLLAAVTAFGILPYAEELWRCWRTKPAIRPLPQPAVPATQTLCIPSDGDTSSAEPHQAATATKAPNHNSAPS
jgi:hypothetical protein